jgi:hypothetical protein
MLGRSRRETRNVENRAGRGILHGASALDNAGEKRMDELDHTPPTNELMQRLERNLTPRAREIRALMHAAIEAGVSGDIPEVQVEARLSALVAELEGSPDREDVIRLAQLQARAYDNRVEEDRGIEAKARAALSVLERADELEPAPETGRTLGEALAVLERHGESPAVRLDPGLAVEIPKGRTMDDGPKLYRVSTTVDELAGYRDVLLTWTADGRKAPPVPYTDALEGLERGHEPDPYQRGAVDELYTLEEAKALAAYLRKHYGDQASRTEIDEQPLPIPSNTMPLGFLPTGGGVGQLPPVHETDYQFIFEVRGCYDPRRHEAVTEPPPVAEWEWGNPHRFGEPARPGELRDLTNTLDGLRQEVAHRLGTEHPLFRLMDEALTSGDLEVLRVARVASDGLLLEPIPF